MLGAELGAEPRGELGAEPRGEPGGELGAALLTDHGGGGSLGAGHHVVRDPQGEGLVVVLVRVLLPPDLELAHRAPASGEAHVPHLPREGAGPLQDQRLIGRLEAVSDLSDHREDRKSTRLNSSH